jgi:hypothetical protein
MGTNLNRAFTLVLLTTPYMVFRAAVYALLSLAVLGYLGVLGLVGWVFGAGAFWVLFLATGVLAVLLGLGRMLDEVLHYFVRAGHVALLSEAAARGRAPTGIGQLRWARERVATRFASIHDLSTGGNTIRRTVRDLNRACFEVESALPIQGLEGSARVAERLVNASLSYLVRGVLGLVFLAPPQRVYTTMCKAMVQYCQAWRPLLTQAVNLSLISYAFVLAVALVIMVPFGAIATFTESASVDFVLFLLTIGVGIVLKGILFDPMADALMVLALLEQSEVHEPDPEWAVKAAEVSKRFRSLEERAATEHFPH